MAAAEKMLGVCSSSLLLFKRHPVSFIATCSHIIPVALLMDHNVYLDKPVKQRL